MGKKYTIRIPATRTPFGETKEREVSITLPWVDKKERTKGLSYDRNPFSAQGAADKAKNRERMYHDLNRRLEDAGKSQDQLNAERSLPATYDEENW